MKRVLAMILAGGQGDRLSILSEERAKPAVIFGGRYRIIDFTLSNCANSGIRRVAILTQYRPRSLIDHIGSGRHWDLDHINGGIHILQPYLGRESSDWYRGTADAVYQNLFFVEESKADEVLVLAGDHVYTMQYEDLVAYHRARDADITVPVYRAPQAEASRYGIVVTDEENRVVDFIEKPAVPPSNLVSTGIYLFRRSVLIEELVADAARLDSNHDFGNDILPHVLRRCRVYAYPFHGYWRDVGTIDAYWQANMDLLVDLPEFDLYNRDTIVRTRPTNLPPVKIGPRAYLSRCLVNLGDIINGHVEHSIISPGAYVEDGAIVRDSVIFDGAHVERGAIVDRTIIDKEVWVGENCHIGGGDDLTPSLERPDLLHSGITLIGKRARLPAGLQVGRNCIVGPAVREGDFSRPLLPSGASIHSPRDLGTLSV